MSRNRNKWRAALDMPRTQAVESPRRRLPIASVDARRPRTRGDCVEGPRPCPWVGCKHHLYFDLTKSRRTLRHSFPGYEPDEIPETCALDVADMGGVGMDTVAELLNVTRARVQQIEDRAKRRLANRFPEMAKLLDW